MNRGFKPCRSTASMLYLKPINCNCTFRIGTIKGTDRRLDEQKQMVSARLIRGKVEMIADGNEWSDANGGIE
jgi:hypothetical protein